MEKQFEEKIAAPGKVLRAEIDGEVIITPRVTAPLGTDMSVWIEVDSDPKYNEPYSPPNEKEMIEALTILGVRL